MFKLQAKKTELCLLEREPTTSGSVNVYEARFEFSEDWEGLEKTAVFRAGEKSVSVLLDDTGETVVPWEVLTVPGKRLEAGVYGTRAAEVVLPTVWTDLGYIRTGAAPGGGARPPTPDIWKQELARKGDTLYYDGLTLRLKSGDKTLSSVDIVGGGSGGVVYKFGHGLKQEGVNVSVDAVSDFKGDNTLPMTAAGVQTTVGNIEALLETI